MQVATGRIHAARVAAGEGPVEAYGAVFLSFSLVLLAGCAIYLLARDRTD
jgi:hypothetical protein